MSLNDDATPDQLVGTTIALTNTALFANPTDNILQYEQAQPYVQKTIDLLIVEMKKVHYQLLKRRKTALQFQNHLEKATFPSNLQQKLSSQNWPTSIPAAAITDINHGEQQLWNSFKKEILSRRSDLFQEDLLDLEKKFKQFADLNYVRLRLTDLCPQFTQHPNVLNGMVLTFSVVLQEFINRPPPTPNRQSGNNTPTSTHSEAQYWNDGMTVDDEDSTQPSSSTFTPPAQASSATSSATSSSSPLQSNSTVQSKKDKSMQDQLNTLTSLVQSLLKNAAGTPSSRERRAPSPKTPTRQPRSTTPTFSTTTTTDKSNLFTTGLATPTRNNKSNKRTPPTPTPLTYTLPSFNGLAPTMQHPFTSAPFHHQYNSYPPQHPYYGHHPIGNQQFGFHPPTYHTSHHQPPPLPQLPPFTFGAPPDSARRTAPGNPGRTPRAPSVRFAKPRATTN